MRVGTQMKHSWMRLGGRLAVLSLLFGWLIGCAPAGTQPVELPTLTPPAPSVPSATTAVETTMPSGWGIYTGQGQCGYMISHPADMEVASQDTYSWILSPSASDSGGTIRNFIYVSTIPSEVPGGEIIYNYDPAEADTLLNMQVGESKPLREDPNTAQWFTYTRLPDTVLSDQSAQTYENTAPWEFPPGTKEIRYYLRSNTCTYLIGGYLDTSGANPAGAINQELFDQIIATFRLTP